MSDPLSPETLAEIEARCEADGSWHYGGMIGDPGKMLAHFVANEAGKPLFFSDPFSVDYASLDLPLKAAAAAVADRGTLLAEARRQAAEIERLSAVLLDEAERYRAGIKDLRSAAITRADAAARRMCDVQADQAAQRLADIERALGEGAPPISPEAREAGPAETDAGVR